MAHEYEGSFGQNGTYAAKYAPETAQSQQYNKPGQIVGIISEQCGGIAWVVSPHRKDKRTGVVNPLPGARQLSGMGPVAQRIMNELSIRKGLQREPTTT
jgi:hypothetical protein